MKLFIFGTLKQNFPNAATNTGTQITGRYQTQQAYPLYLVGERYSPWLIDHPGQGMAVTGELYEVDATALAAMDKLERIDQIDGYRRVEITLSNLCDATTVLAQAYLKPLAQLLPEQIKLGPLPCYEQQHAALYSKRKNTTA